jgi:hypothetical protein
VQANGVVLHADVSTSDEAAHLNDYSFVQAEGRGEALELVRDHPLRARLRVQESSCSKCRRRARKPDPLHRQRPDAPRGMGRAQRLRDRHASPAQRRQQKILPEQALGRGLRRMTPPGSGFDERVVVIEHEAFRNLWSAELDGGLVVEKEDVDKIEPGEELRRRLNPVLRTNSS